MQWLGTCQILLHKSFLQPAGKSYRLRIRSSDRSCNEIMKYFTSVHQLFFYWKHFGGKWVKPFFLNISFFLCCFWQILESFFIVCFIFWFFFAKAFLLRFLAFFFSFFCSSFFFLCILKHGDESTFYLICATERFRSWGTVILGHFRP